MSLTFTLIPTPEYKADLRAALSYIRDDLDSPIAAVDFAKGIIRAEEQLASFPRSAPLSQKPGIAGRGIREKISGNHVIVYKVDDTNVYLLRLFHQSQDYEHGVMSL